jgi:hypothetical protein
MKLNPLPLREQLKDPPRKTYLDNTKGLSFMSSNSILNSPRSRRSRSK